MKKTKENEEVEEISKQSEESDDEKKTAGLSALLARMKVLINFKYE
jgi:hypothetical protein